MVGNTSLHVQTTSKKAYIYMDIHELQTHPWINTDSYN